MRDGEWYGPVRAFVGHPEDGEPMECPDCGSAVMQKGCMGQSYERWCENPYCEWQDGDEIDFEAIMEARMG